MKKFLQFLASIAYKINKKHIRIAKANLDLVYENKISEERKEDTLTITLTNGDIDLFNQAIEKYNFIDGQAMLRFALSLLIIAEDKEIKINKC